MKRIENMTNEEFKSVDNKEIQKLSPEEQYHILFECKNDRINNITTDQFQGIHQETISIFLHSVDNNNVMEDKLIKFIPTINFKFLSIDNIALIFEKKDEVISREQIHQIDLFKVKKMNQKLYQKIIIQKYFNFSFDQLYFLTQNGNLNDIEESNLPKKFLNIINIIKNTKTFARFNIYCSNPDKYALQKDIMTDMPLLLKIIYLVNYIEKVNDEIKNDFQSSVDFLFSNPSLFCSDIFLFLINEWPKKIISKSINTKIDINNFPKNLLFVLFKKFDLSNETMNQFQINEIYKIQNREHHNFIFRALLNFYIDAKNTAKIQQINIQILDKDEIEFFIDKCCNHLKKDQIWNSACHF